MSRRANADVVVPREWLGDPGRRYAIRRKLYTALSELGRVDAVVAFVADPPDGPYREGHYQRDLDVDRFAVVRIVGEVSPLRRAGGEN